LEDSEQVDVESQNVMDAIVMNRVDNNNNNVVESDDVVINEPDAETPTKENELYSLELSGSR